jgi:hypothetical protein
MKERPGQHLLECAGCWTFRKHQGCMHLASSKQPRHAKRGVTLYIRSTACLDQAALTSTRASAGGGKAAALQWFVIVDLNPGDQTLETLWHDRHSTSHGHWRLASCRSTLSAARNSACRRQSRGCKAGGAAGNGGNSAAKWRSPTHRCWQQATGGRQRWGCAQQRRQGQGGEGA